MAGGPPFELVFFDCDSTLSTVEGIDALAERKGVQDVVAPLTRAAMEGRLALDEVYGARLERIRPSRDDIHWLGARYIERMVPGARRCIDVLQRLGKEVHIISGGIQQAVEVLATALDVPAAHVHAVPVLLDTQGQYCAFDSASPLCRSGGKREVCRRLLSKRGPAALVGDGITDLEPADLGIYIVGFGGVARREAVRAQADTFVDSPSLLDTLSSLLSPEEHARVVHDTHP